jgi:selenide, water dikinase
MTDITGFGLAGHLVEVCEGSGVSAEISYSAIQNLPGVAECMKQRTMPDATFRNWNAYSKQIGFEKGVDVMEAFNLLPDPQTNGGLLVSVNPSAKEEIISIFKEYGLEDHLQPIGMIVSATEKRIIVKP